MPSEPGDQLHQALQAAELVAMRRNLLSLAVQQLEPVFLGNTEAIFDHAVAAFLLVSIGTSDDETHKSLPRWLHMLKFMVLNLSLSEEVVDLDEETKEERRRYRHFPSTIHSTG
jgi:hypothetical protein